MKKRRTRYYYDGMSLFQLAKDSGIPYSTLYRRVQLGQHPLDKKQYATKHFVDKKGRECTKCGEYKTWDCFYNHKRGIKGKGYVCIGCTA